MIVGERLTNQTIFQLHAEIVELSGIRETLKNVTIYILYLYVRRPIKVHKGIGFENSLCLSKEKVQRRYQICTKEGGRDT